jgi:hypothetical protein
MYVPLSIKLSPHPYGRGLNFILALVLRIELFPLYGVGIIRFLMVQC